MNDTPRFSVIIPAHNAAEYMRTGLESIRSQTCWDYELIVVCDACDDNTEQIAREYTSRVISVNYGLDGLTRNAGIDMARGEYILFMDDDDWWADPRAFEKLARAALTHPEADVILFGFHWRTIGDKLQHPGQIFIAVWNKCWRRDFIGDTRFPAKPYWSDVDFSREALGRLRPERAVFLPEVLYYYNYLRPGSISWRKEMGEIE